MTPGLKCSLYNGRQSGDLGKVSAELILVKKNNLNEIIP
ncbi:hypothetical protein D1AOALGA4SA_2902 [Olavius algarvensis Delta 1 endosymbiont]|nr:hypothetical protein D1AOALGA4SA_2902 [Olavius algarvensis Delta 1 endosymbiont]